MKKSIPKNKMSKINNEKFDAGPQPPLVTEPLRGPSGPGAFSAQNLEHLNKILNYNSKTVRIFGTNDRDSLGGTLRVQDPWFCGRDICEILEYSDYRKALFKFVDDENKKSLKDLCVVDPTTHKFHYNEERMTYINEEGLYSLIFACKFPNAKPLKAFMDQFFYDLRYKFGIVDIFTFIKDKKVAIDVNSPWFQELWYPISKRTHILGSMRLLDWMGYAGEYFTQKQHFKKFFSKK